MLRVELLSAIRETDRATFGSKTVTLSVLARHGFPVPQGFGIALAYPHAAKLDADEREALRAAYRELANALGPDPRGEDPAVAVRSSIGGEDGAESSFAGQYSSFLDVRGGAELVDAVEACIESVHSERAVAYRRSVGATIESVGVLVQEMVKPDFAGVCFTRAPGAEESVLVEFVDCLADEMVSGVRTPTSVYLDREDLAPGRVLDADERLEGLGIERVREVARMGLDIESRLDIAFDIEWASADGRPVLLQARPITGGALLPSDAEICSSEIDRLRELASRAAAAGEKLTVWTDISVRDMHPRSTPLGLDLLRGLAQPEGSFGKALAAIGLRWTGRRRPGEVFEPIAGHLYYNLNALLAYAVEDLPVVLDERPFRDPEFVPDVDNPPRRLAWPGWTGLLRLPAVVVRWLLVAPRKFIRTRRTLWEEFLREVRPAAEREAATLRKQDLGALSVDELVDSVGSAVERFTGLHYYHQAADMLAVGTGVMLGLLLRIVYGRERARVRSRLTTGLPGNFNTETNLALAELALGTLTMDAFLDRFGQRGSPDYDVSAARWREDPRTVEAMAGAISRSAVDPQAQFAKQTTIRAEAEEELQRRIGSRFWLRPLRRRMMSELRYFQTYSPLRESTQGVAFLWVERIRALLLELGRRTGLGDSIFYLDLAQIEKIGDAAEVEGLGEVARAARRRYFAGRRLYVPHVLRSDDLGALVLEQGGALSHPAIVAREYGLPAVVGVAHATSLIKNGQEVVVDAGAGRILLDA